MRRQNQMKALCPLCSPQPSVYCLSNTLPRIPQPSSLCLESIKLDCSNWAAQVHIGNLATDLFNLKWGISCSFNLSVNDVSLFVVSTAYQFLESAVRQAPAGPPSWAVLGTGCSFLALAQVLTAASSQEICLSHSQPNLQLVLYKPN